MHMGAWAPLEIFRSGTWVSKWMDGWMEKKKINLKVEKRTGKFFWMPI
jgi:hypothetical protein